MEPLTPKQTPILAPQTPLEKPKIMRSFDTGNKKNNNLFVIIGSVVVVLAGVATGWLLTGKTQAGSVPDTSSQQEDQVKRTEDEAGVENTEDFPDTVEGKLVEGGIDGEGTHRLERTGGPSQNVYLSSTVIDLQSFVGKNVKIWGQTLSGKKAGWLMDVGRIKVIQ